MDQRKSKHNLASGNKETLQGAPKSFFNETLISSTAQMSREKFPSSGWKVPWIDRYRIDEFLFFVTDDDDDLGIYGEVFFNEPQLTVLFSRHRPLFC